MRNSCKVKGTNALSTWRQYAVNVSLGLLGAIALTSCTNGSDDCGPFDTTVSVQTITTTDLQSVQVVPANESSLDNSMVQTGNETQASLDDIEIQVAMEFNATPITSTSKNAWSLLDWILPSAHACSPAFVSGDVQSRLQTIDMFSAADMSADYPAGESLAPLFSVTETIVDDVFYGITGLLYPTAMQNLDNRSIPMMLNFSIKRSGTSALTPDVTADPNIHRFTITIELENGMSFSMDSNDVSLPFYESL